MSSWSCSTEVKARCRRGLPCSKMSMLPLNFLDTYLSLFSQTRPRPPLHSLCGMYTDFLLSQGSRLKHPQGNPGNAKLTQASPQPDLRASLSSDDSLLWSQKSLRSRQCLKGYFQTPDSECYICYRSKTSATTGSKGDDHQSVDQYKAEKKSSCGTEKVFPFRKVNNQPPKQTKKRC